VAPGSNLLESEDIIPPPGAAMMIVVLATISPADPP
jgi:hypothetical protein